MINNTVLTGRLTRDPELKQTGNGIAVVNFTLAVNRTFKNANGEQEADFIMCQAWRGTAEAVANYLKKGSLIGVEGRIQTRNYEDTDGKTIYITEVVVDNLTFLESKNSNNQNQADFGRAGSYKSGMSQPRTSNPGTNQNYDDPFVTDDVADIKDDDLPF